MYRRDFIKTTLASAAVLPFHSRSAASTAGPAIKTGVFSKHLQWLNYQDTADIVAEIGWQGIECPVRPGGHVLPERVEEDLPAFVEALKKNGLELFMATTNIQDVTESHAETILRTCASLGIKYYRIGGYKYKKEMSVPERLNEIRAQLNDLVALNKELGLCAAYQNHSGTDIGAAVWDIYELIKDFDNKNIGIAFDIGHATVEGGYAWPVHYKLMQPFTKVVIVKDFKWGKTDNGDWRALWGPLGDGMIDRDFFGKLCADHWENPIIQHFEYSVEGKTEPDKHKNLIIAMKKDCQTLKNWLSEAGF
ncbi:sugar phosphate isomerase/epimerase [candidate division KSB1 bacterium]|nr:sugar phosphate isomerase/epimerase [candidate division KSB1 bacterium]